MYSVKKILNNWEYLKGSFPEYSIHQRIFHSLIMVFIGTAFVGFVLAFFLQSLSVALVLLGLIVFQIPLLYFSRFHNQFRTCYVIWIVLNHVFAITFFFTQGGFNIPIWNFFITIFFATSLISKPQYYTRWYIVHFSIFLALLYIEYQHPSLISFTSYSRDIFYLKVFYSSVFTSLVIHFYINFIIVNYTNKRKKLECQRAESELRGERLRELNEQKNKLISVISHDFNTPLNNIKRYLDLLQHIDLESDQRKELEKELLLVTIESQNLLMNLLTWSKNNMEGMKFVPEIVNLNDALATTKQLYTSIAQDKKISLVYQIDTSVHVMGSYEMIDIVIRNLVNNAIKFTPEGGQVRIETKRENNFYKISVIDNGIGFSQEVAQKLYSTKGKSSLGTEQEKGAGIGLSISKEFVELMNGSVGIKSQVNVGSEFYILLPAADFSADELEEL